MTDRGVIDRFRGTYEFLSNFYPARIEFDGIVYYNAEAAYQAQKCAKHADRAQFARLYGDEAKSLGRKVPLRSDWNAVKLPLMERIVREKFFANPHLARRLVGDNYRYLMPAAMLFGAIFLLAVDSVSRNLLATEIPIGILTSFIGAPFFLHMIAGGGERR